MVKKKNYQRVPWKFLNCSHKKLKANLNRASFAAELEFAKIQVRRLPQNPSNINIECTGKSKQFYSFCNQRLGPLISLFYSSDISVFLIDYAWWKLCDIGCSLSRTIPEVSLYKSNTGVTTLLQLWLLMSDRWQFENSN